MGATFLEAEGSETVAAEGELARLQALASLPKGLSVDDQERVFLRGLVARSLEKPSNGQALAKMRATADSTKSLVGSDDSRALETMGALEIPNLDPDQASLNLQLALTRLVSDKREQDYARLHGREFQQMYNLTNDQMLTLCRLAVDLGAYEDTSELRSYMDAFGQLDPVLRSLSPSAVQKLGLQGEELCMATCSCCCP